MRFRKYTQFLYTDFLGHDHIVKADNLEELQRKVNGKNIGSIRMVGNNNKYSNEVMLPGGKVVVDYSG